MEEYSVLITYKAEDLEELKKLYVSNPENPPLIQQIFELASTARSEGYTFVWKEGSEVK